MARCTHWTPLVCLLLLASCGSSSSSTRPAGPKKPTPAPEATAPPTARKPLAFEGRWVSVGTEFEVVGHDGVGVRGADLVIAVRRTKWTELDMGGKTFREGSAELDILTSEGARVAHVDLDGSTPVDGFDVFVTYVGDAYDDSGRTVPNAKLIVKKR